MMCRCLCALVLAAAAAGVVAAADPIKLGVKDFKAKAGFEGGDKYVVTYEDQGKILLAVNGTATAEVTIPADGEYVVTVKASCDEAKGEKAKIKVKVGSEVLADRFELTATGPREYTFPAELTKGPAKLVIEFQNDEAKEGEYDRNFYLYSAKIEAKK